MIERVALHQTQITVEGCIDVGFELQCGFRGVLGGGGGWRVAQLSESRISLIIPGDKLLLLDGFQLLGTGSEYRTVCTILGRGCRPLVEGGRRRWYGFLQLTLVGSKSELHITPFIHVVGLP